MTQFAPIGGGATQPTDITPVQVEEAVASSASVVNDSEPDKVRVENFIRSLVDSAEFYIVRQADNGQVMTTGERAKPASVLVNEIEEEVEEDPRYGRSLRLRVVRWVFSLRLDFSAEVTTEQFDKILRSVPKLPGSSVAGQMMVRLESKTANHPTKRRATGGSRIRYTLNVGVPRN
jgi:hypothetical protein